MTSNTRLRTSVAAVALAVSASGAFAMAPVDQFGRGYQAGEQASMGNDDSGNAVRSRQFSDTRALESSGRGSAIDQPGSSAFQEEQDKASGQAQTGDSGNEASTYESSPQASSEPSSQGVNEQTARNEDLNAYEAGSGYTSDGQDFAAAGSQDEKLLVIVPSNWNGSLPELIAALDQTTDDSAIVVVDKANWNPDAVDSASRSE